MDLFHGPLIPHFETFSTIAILIFIENILSIVNKFPTYTFFKVQL